MEQWHYDPTAFFDETQWEQLRASLHLPRMLETGVRSVAAVLLRGWLHFYHRLMIAGRHNLPRDRSFVLVANHASHLDTLCLLSALPIARLHQAFPAAAEDYFCVTALRGLLARVFVNALPFDRQFAPLRSLSMCARLLEEPGNILIFFPEGTRSPDATPAEFKPGVALLAAGRDIPIVPCHLSGTHAALPKGRWLPRPKKVRLTIGAPRFYAHLPATKDSARHICRDLREAVVQLGYAGLTVDLGARGDTEVPGKAHLPGALDAGSIRGTFR
jgi:1-acyl-sn-glycerol-3-phosphate acyltransferase